MKFENSYVSMKITYIFNMRIPSEQAHPLQVMKMCEAFVNRGAEIELVIPYREQSPKMIEILKTMDAWEYYGIKKNSFRIKKLPAIDLLWFRRATKEGRGWGYISENFMRVRFMLLTWTFTISATLYSLFKKADVYYTRDPFFASLFSFLSFSHKRKIYCEAHIFEAIVNRLMKKGKIAGLIVITKKIKELYMKEEIPEGKILVAPDGVDLRMFDNHYSKEDVRKELSLPEGSKIIGYVGQLHTMGMEKGTEELIEAFKMLKEQMNGLILCFVGGPDGKIGEYAELIKKNGLKESVIFTGQKTPPEVPLYMKAFDVCAMPFPWTQHYAYYMSPLKLFEYMASKRPIVATDLPSIREILNEENAVLVEPGNPEALAKGIEKVLNDEELAKRIAEKAYEDVQQYAWDRRAGRILEFILGNKAE